METTERRPASASGSLVSSNSPSSAHARARRASSPKSIGTSPVPIDDAERASGSRAAASRPLSATARPGRADAELRAARPITFTDLRNLSGMNGSGSKSRTSPATRDGMIGRVKRPDRADAAVAVHARLPERVFANPVQGNDA